MKKILKEVPNAWCFHGYHCRVSMKTNLTQAQAAPPPTMLHSLLHKCEDGFNSGKKSKCWIGWNGNSHKETCPWNFSSILFLRFFFFLYYINSFISYNSNRISPYSLIVLMTLWIHYCWYCMHAKNSAIWESCIIAEPGFCYGQNKSNPYKVTYFFNKSHISKYCKSSLIFPHGEKWEIRFTTTSIYVW